MNVVDAFALFVQATAHLNTLARILQQARLEGREQLTLEEMAQFRALAVASEERLEAAVARAPAEVKPTGGL